MHLQLVGRGAHEVVNSRRVVKKKKEKEKDMVNAQQRIRVQKCRLND
jgi:hypothetical protein